MQRNETPVESPLPKVAAPPLHVLSLEQLRAVTDRRTRWLWQGYLAAGGVTLLTGQWKVGKTTLLAALLAQLQAGGDLGGRTVSTGKAVVVSEEEGDHWLRRAERFALGDHLQWMYRPFHDRSSPAQWLAFLRDFVESLANSKPPQRLRTPRWKRGKWIFKCIYAWFGSERKQGPSLRAQGKCRISSHITHKMHWAADKGKRDLLHRCAERKRSLEWHVERETVKTASASC
jgi:hypothetical protein